MWDGTPYWTNTLIYGLHGAMVSLNIALFWQAITLHNAFIRIVGLRLLLYLYVCLLAYLNREYICLLLALDTQKMWKENAAHLPVDFLWVAGSQKEARWENKGRLRTRTQVLAKKSSFLLFFIQTLSKLSVTEVLERWIILNYETSWTNIEGVCRIVLGLNTCMFERVILTDFEI